VRFLLAALATAALALAALAVGVVAEPTAAATAAAPAWTKNCTAMHRKYPHGVGRVGARDKTSGTPVTNFKRSNTLYATAMRYNRGLDRDGDKIACEQA
jgi:hypothetical protein